MNNEFINIISYNAHSVNKKVAGISEFLNGRSCDVCFICESWMHDSYTSIVSEFNDYGFRVLNKTRKNKRGGGLCALYKSNLNVKMSDLKLKLKTFEVMETTIKSNSTLLRVSNIYRTGYMTNSDFSAFYDEMDDYLGLLVQKPGQNIICGDLNIHVEEHGNKQASEFLTLMGTYDFCQMVNSPTHNHNGTLDLVFVNNNDQSIKQSVSSSLIVHDIYHSVTSDHCFIEYKVPFCKDRHLKNKINITYRDYNCINITSLKSDLTTSLNEMDPYIPGNLSNFVKQFESTLAIVMDRHAPLLQRTVNEKRTEFTTPEIINLRRKRRKAERQYRKQKNSGNLASFYNLQNSVFKAVRKSRNAFYSSKFAHSKGKQKETYQIFNKLIGKQQGKKPLPEHTDEKQLSERFKDFFHTKILKVRKTISDDLTQLSNDHMQFPNTSCDVDKSLTMFAELTDKQILELFKAMPNKFCSLDVFPPWLVNECFEILLPYLRTIINSSLNEGVVSDSFKVAHIKPLLKNSALDKDLLCNYRPVSNLSFLSKLLERCVLAQFTKYLNTNEMFCEIQSAYRKFHSCETALIKICDDILRGLDSGKSVFVLFLDLSAAFDTIQHDLLLNILKAKFGIAGKVLQWFESYLFSRQYKVEIGKSISDVICFLFGVPQGSILGPILFVLYISDLDKVVRAFGLKIHCFADDAQLYIAFEAIDVLPTIDVIQSCLESVKCWMTKMFLRLNEDKTQLLVISPTRSLVNANLNTSLCFGDEIIKSEIKAKNLGVIFDNAMSFNPQINNIVSSGYNTLRNLWNIAGTLTLELKLQLVHALIISKIDYSSTILLTANKGNRHRLQKLLNSSVRFIYNLTGERYSNHITPYLKKLHILPVEYRIKYKVALYVYKCVHGLAPPYLSSLVHQKFANYDLCCIDDLFLLDSDFKPKTHFGRSAFSYSCLNTWNSLPADLKMCSDIVHFKKRLKTHYFRLCFD